MTDKDIMPLICIRCKKDIPLTYGAMKEVSYTHYSYCEDCLRKGLKALKAWDDLYKKIYDHHYEILKSEPGERRDAKLSLSNWILDAMTVPWNPLPDLPSAEPGWIPVTERLPKELTPVNITYVNEDPAPYYEHIKGIPFTATAIFYRGGWYWWSCTCVDVLAEYGHSYSDSMDEGIEVTAWMPLPEPYQGGDAE